ncbi:MAG: tRNA lysidine(34) synthetase TilS [Azoarcus sp.]|nr:tRNA lysidine(34) synthetase TilS [Azoarcus sp.]
MTTLLDTAAATLNKAGIDSRHRLCCALSGGVDSVVLLDILNTLQPRFGYALQAAHVHHHLCAEADEWQDFCVAHCQRYGIPLQVFRVDVSRDHPGGLEEAARIARYNALSQVSCHWLALGHHRDDQAETVLFRLLRGAGVRGTAAMATIELASAPGQPGRLRPLLENSRAEISAYANDKNLAWVNDASNADPRFARNGLRHHILPAIEARFPAARATLARAAKHFREAADLLDELAKIDGQACQIPHQGLLSVTGTCGADAAAACFSRTALLALSPARLANLFRYELRRLGARPPSAARLSEALRQLCATPAPLTLPLGDFTCFSKRGRVWFSTTP